MRPIAWLCAAPIVVALAALVAPIVTDPVVLFGGIPYDLRASWLPGFTTIDPNQGYTSYALGVRAARDLLSGVIPLWNPYEGLGSPLLGEMAGAALFPPTLLLLLPHGQIIEQAFLQIVAGIGTFLFLRRFGLTTTAALAGGFLFEFNGVFAWLRNAIYNPVALLPWLFYAVESLFAAATVGLAWRRRFGSVAVGALAAALALYAGFPEVVFYYCMPLFGWAALRGVSLPWRRTLSYLGDLTLLGVVALLLSAPLLLAFAHLVIEGDVGAHTDDLLKDAVIQPAGALMYLLPYVFGPISFSPIQAVAVLWGNGGYLGLVAFVLAVGGLFAAWRRPVVWWLATWIVFAVGVSHGAPGLLAAFQHVPLVTISAFSRYLNTGWLFCAVTLAAVFIDRLPSLPPAHRRRACVTAAGIAALVLAGAVTLAWPVLREAWQPHQQHRIYIVVSGTVALLVLSGVVAASSRRRPDRALMILATVEAVLLFAVPFASSPAASKLDLALVEFLQQHVGLQRIAMASGTGLMPNYGSAFAVPTLNYDDALVPRRTVGFVQRELEPDAVPIMFRPGVVSRPDTPAERRDRFVSRLPGYERAGVRYVLADAAFFSISLALDAPGRRPVALAAGQAATLTLQPRPGLTAIAAASALIGTFRGLSDGSLTAQLCQAGRCQRKSADLVTAADNVPIRMAFVPPFDVGDAPFQLTLSKQGGSHPVALWSAPPSTGEATTGEGLPEMQGVLPQVAFESASMPRFALQTPTTTVFELAHPVPYASAPDCHIDARSHTLMVTECARPARLTRLEVLMNGWAATINGAASPVTLVDDTFQAVELPAGRSVVEFVYAPAGVRPALWIAAATLIALTIAWIITAIGGGARRPRRQPGSNGT